VSEQPEEFPGPELVQAARDMFSQRQQAPPPWRPQCVICLNGHKLAIETVKDKLVASGLAIGSPEFIEQIRQAAQAGQMLMMNPMALQGMNGTRPDIIPAVRLADVMIGGSGVCAYCYVPQKQTSLLTAPGGWVPGR
jgi:hypothetical protein